MPDEWHENEEDEYFDACTSAEVSLVIHDDDKEMIVGLLDYDPRTSGGASGQRVPQFLQTDGHDMFSLDTF